MAPAEEMGPDLEPYTDGSSTREPLEPVATFEIDGPLTLAQAISLTTERSPKLRAYAFDVRSASARARQARLWPNPELEAEVENIGGSGDFIGSSEAETTLSLAQALPLGGDMGRRRQLAELQVELEDWDYHAVRLEVVKDVTLHYIAALAAEQELELATRMLRLAKDTERITSARVEAGDASPVESTRMVVPVLTAELAVDRARRMRDAAYRRLALGWGSETATFDNLSGQLSNLSEPPDAAALSALVNESPLVARWATEISARTAEMRLAQAEAVPDLRARAGFKHDRSSGDAALVLGISLPVPILDRNQGSIAAAQLDRVSAERRKEAAELRIESMLSAAYAELASAYDEATALREQALPAAEAAFEATQRAFREGELPFLDVLDAQRTLFALQGQYLNALETYHTMTAEIESLIGRRLSSISN